MIPKKALSVIGAIQVGAVVMGALFVTVYMKIWGYSTADGMAGSLRWNPRSVWIRESGWMLVAVPLLWLAAMLWVTRKTERYSIVSISGGLVLLGLIALYADAIINAYIRPIFSVSP